MVRDSDRAPDMTSQTFREITSARLRLRPLVPNDLDAVHRLWTEPEVRKYLWDDEIISREKA
ncbi:MAG TPA: GNAT family N-acetyltransferase, partial [Rubrobacteraceae bacterium]|nr:GNAT family N-acetyltransferase [Rubrobacteraceae bacterium]